MKGKRKIRLRRPSRAAVAVMTTLAAAAALQVWLHLKVTDLGYELAAMRQIGLRLSSEKGELEAELATLTSPPVLDRVARARLGMRPPREGQIVGVP